MKYESNIVGMYHLVTVTWLSSYIGF